MDNNNDDPHIEIFTCPKGHDLTIGYSEDTTPHFVLVCNECQRFNESIETPHGDIFVGFRPKQYKPRSS